MTQGWQRVGAMRALPGVVRDLKIDPAEVAAAAGIDLAQLVHRNSQIPFEAACLLAKSAAEMTGCDHIGLLVAAQDGSDTRSIGAVGALMRNAPTLGRALLDLCENHHRYVRGGVPYLVARDGYAWLGYSIYHDAGASVEHFQVGALAVGFSMARELASARPEEVLLSRKAPADPTPAPSATPSVA